MRAAESFKIVQLPERGEIINICTMTVRNKERSGSPKSAEKEAHMPRKKIISVSKLNTLAKPSTEGGNVNPLKFRTTSIKDIRKFSVTPQINFDYF